MKGRSLVYTKGKEEVWFILKDMILMKIY